MTKTDVARLKQTNHEWLRDLIEVNKEHNQSMFDFWIANYYLQSLTDLAKQKRFEENHKKMEATIDVLETINEKYFG